MKRAEAGHSLVVFGARCMGLMPQKPEVGNRNMGRVYTYQAVAEDSHAKIAGYSEQGMGDPRRDAMPVLAELPAVPAANPRPFPVNPRHPSGWPKFADT